MRIGIGIVTFLRIVITEDFEKPIWFNDGNAIVQGFTDLQFFRRAGSATDDVRGIFVDLLLIQSAIYSQKSLDKTFRGLIGYNDAASTQRPPGRSLHGSSSHPHIDDINWKTNLRGSGNSAKYRKDPIHSSICRRKEACE
jgi:hypothetical protein